MTLHLTRSLLKVALLAMNLAPSIGCSTSNTIAIRETAAAEIPDSIRQFAPALATPAFVVHRDTDSRGKLTGMRANGWGTASFFPVAACLRPPT
ncbi:MAG: hypothetical protein ACREJD_10660 [Phycisphaerales bacterium]